MSRTPGGITCAGGISSPRSASRSATPPLTHGGNANDALALARDDRRARDLGLRVRERPRRRGRRHGAREPPGARRPRRDHARVLVPRAARRLPAQPAPEGAAARRAARCTSRPTSRSTAAIQPRVDAEAPERDVLAETCRAAAARGMRVDAWTIFLHADRAGRAPGLRHRQRLRRPLPGRPLPGEPRRRARTRARSSPTSAATTSARSSPSRCTTTRCEHGHEHERYLIELGTKARYLLGLCFCEHCLARAAAAGVDGERVAGGGARRARARVRRPRRGRDGRARAGDARGRGRRRAARLPRRARRHRDLARRGGRRGRATRRASASSSWIRPARSRATGRASPRAARPPRSAGGSGSTCPRSPPSAPRCRCSPTRPTSSACGSISRRTARALGDATVSVVLRPIPPDCETRGEPRREARARARARADVGRDLPLRLPPPRGARPGPRGAFEAGLMRFDLLIQRRRGRRPGRRARGAARRRDHRRPDRRRRPATSPTEAAFRVIDAEGQIVTPGLVDLHTHVFHKVTYWGIDPDPVASVVGRDDLERRRLGGRADAAGPARVRRRPRARADHGVPQHLEHRPRRRELRVREPRLPRRRPLPAPGRRRTATSSAASRCGWARRPWATTASSRCASRAARPRSASCR